MIREEGEVDAAVGVGEGLVDLVGGEGEDGGGEAGEGSFGGDGGGEKAFVGLEAEAVAALSLMGRLKATDPARMSLAFSR